MGDNRISHSGRNHLFDVGQSSNRADLFLRSESPRVQQILLHQRLRDEIEKNSNCKVRYVDSELYLRNQELRSSATASSQAGNVPLSEVQSATLDIGLPLSATTSTNKQSSRIPINSTSSITARDNKSSTKDEHQATTGASSSNPLGHNSIDLIVDDINDHQHRRDTHQPGSADRGNCQVCRIKKVREDLMNLNKIIQERNVHFSELKAKCLRSYFKRQMID